MRDVTHRKRAEQALRLSEEKFESVFRSSPDAIALTTLTEGRFLDVNHQFDRLTGYRREEVLGRTAVDLGFWQDVKDRAGLIAAASDKGMLRDFERQLRVKSGKLRTVAFSGEVIEWAGQQCLVAVLHDVTARKQAEAALRREALTFENMYDAVLVVNKDGTIADCNPAATRLFGYQKTELLGHTVSILHGAGHATLLHSTIPAELDSVGRWEGELPFVRKDGSKGTCETVIVPLRDEHGNRIAGIGVSRDVTERKHTEQALRESELQMRLLLDSTAEAIFGLDLEGRCTFCNPACLRMLGYNSPEELLGKNMHGTMHHTRADGTPCPIHDCHIYRSLWQQVPIHIQDEVLWRANGTSFPAEYWSYPIRKRGEVVGCVVTFLDISERKRAQKALQESEEKYRVLVENATYGIFRSTADGKILDVNPAFVAMLGYDSKEEVLSLNLDSDIYQNSDNRQEILRSYGKEPRRVYAETELRRKDGSGITVRMKGRVVHGVDPKSEWYEAIAEDVTQQRSLEAQFRQSQKMEAVGRLAGGIAHDFNNILMIINSCAELILGTASSDANTQRYAEQIIQAGGKAASLTAQLLAFSRKQILQPTILDLGAVVTELGMMLPRVLRRDIEMSIFVDSQLGKVNADRAQIEQVLMNLAVNARDAMPKGGKLQIEVRNAEVDSAYVQRRRQVAMGRYVVLAVSDTGVGMDPETQASIFEPFFTTKGLGKGTGLGLSTVYGIVKQSGGFIWSYSEPGLGSTFKVYLPRVDPAADAAPLAEEETGEGQVGHGKIVLLVDDESDLRSAVREFLEAKGYLVLEAENGTQALEVCHRHRSSIAVLLTDLIMPGMSGAELAAHICSVNPDVKTIYMSGYMDRSKYVENLGPDAVFLQKPFSLKTLARKLQSAVQPSPNPGKTGTSSATGPQD
ncbi:MAG: PAS domain S-box protein [Acidobacteriia bacterium]|nr:PAS domain S-box protein [Terriglobia bacterium]